MKEETKKKARDLTKTRQSILDAAAQEFSEYGFSGARVDRISQQAGCNKAMIYYIFKNKDELHLAVLENLFEEKVREVETYLKKDQRSVDDLFPMLRAYLKTFFEKQAYARMILYDIATGANTLRALRDRRPDLFAELDVIAGLIRSMGEAGVVRKVDPDKSVTVIVLLVVGLANLLPHVDLLAAPGTAQFKALSDQNQWMSFLADMLGRVLKPDVS